MVLFNIDELQSAWHSTEWLILGCLILKGLATLAVLEKSCNLKLFEDYYDHFRVALFPIGEKSRKINLMTRGDARHGAKATTSSPE